MSHKFLRNIEILVIFQDFLDSDYMRMIKPLKGFKFLSKQSLEGRSLLFLI